MNDEPILSLITRIRAVIFAGFLFGLIIGTYSGAALVRIKVESNCESYSQALTAFIKQNYFGALSVVFLFFICIYLLHIFNRQIAPELVRRSNADH